jgi:hypothetical protein
MLRRVPVSPILIGVTAIAELGSGRRHALNLARSRACCTRNSRYYPAFPRKSARISQGKTGVYQL